MSHYLLDRLGTSDLPVQTTGHETKTLRDVLASAAEQGFPYVIFMDGSGLGNDMAHPATEETLQRYLSVERAVAAYDAYPEWQGTNMVLSRVEGGAGWTYSSLKHMAAGVDNPSALNF